MFSRNVIPLATQPPATQPGSVSQHKQQYTRRTPPAHRQTASAPPAGGGSATQGKQLSRTFSRDAMPLTMQPPYGGGVRKDISTPEATDTQERVRLFSR